MRGISRHRAGWSVDRQLAICRQNRRENKNFRCRYRYHYQRVDLKRIFFKWGGGGGGGGRCSQQEKGEGSLVYIRGYEFSIPTMGS